MGQASTKEMLSRHTHHRHVEDEHSQDMGHTCVKCLEALPWEAMASTDQDKYIGEKNEGRVRQR